MMSRARLYEIVRFCIAGGGGFIIDYGLLYALTEYAGVPYLWSSGISFTVSVLVNYWLCVVYVFRAAGGHLERCDETEGIDVQGSRRRRGRGTAKRWWVWRRQAMSQISIVQSKTERRS